MTEYVPGSRAPRRPPSRRRAAFPTLKGAHKGIDLAETEQKCDLADAKVRLCEQSSRRPMTKIVEDILVGRTKLAKPALQ
jgi:hypothetical protein